MPNTHSAAAATADDARHRLDREAELTKRVAQLYRARLAELIAVLNRSAGPVADPSASAATTAVRHCIEAVDLVLASHVQFASSLKQLARAA